MPFFIIIGVSGCGKTTIGKLLAQRLAAPFYDADDYHPPENIAKMSNGIPLNDDDRAPWLDRLHQIIREHVDSDTTAVLACSALKKTYRDRLKGQLQTVQLVHLEGHFDLIWQRMQAREGHYMKAAMLQSQFQTLERPNSHEAVTFSIEMPPASIVNHILKHTK